MFHPSPDQDRFIPTRTHPQPTPFSSSKSLSPYETYIQQTLCPVSRVLSFRNREDNELKCSRNGYQGGKRAEFGDGGQREERKGFGHCRGVGGLRACGEPEKILDVPAIRDDFYLNTLDWSPLGPLAVSLDNEVYLYTPANILELCKILDGSYVSSLKFYDSTLSIGYSDGKIRIYDLQTTSLIRQITEHQKRVSVLSFTSKNTLYSGSKDRNILVHDIRLKEPTKNRLTGHRGQICSLKCQPEQNYLASGSNDNTVAIWDIRRHQLMRKYTEHKGAVKAISWCPWKSGVIATAGGAGDKAIRVWNVDESQDLALRKTDSQISSLLWNQQTGLLISSHGHPNNVINFWKPEVVRNKALTLEKVKELKGHTGRILNLAMSPSENMVCSLSADETLRFWRFVDSEQDPWQEKQGYKTARWSFKLK